VLLLKLVLNNWSVEQAFKGIKKLEFSDNGVTVIKALSENGCKPSLEFSDSLSEFVEVVVELPFLNIHDVVLYSHELFNSLVEFFKDLIDSCGQSLTFSVTNFYLLQLVELNDGAGEMHDVLASL